MTRSIHAVLALGWLSLSTASAPAHFNMLLPDRASVKRGESVTFTYQWGHPFEHQLFDAPVPQEVLMLSPGSATPKDMGKALEKTSVPAGEGKRVTAYRFRFSPEQRGDFVFVLSLPPIWMEDDQEFLQDKVKVVLHVQAQKGWDQDFCNSHHPLDLTPFTRPYGLQAGMAFQAQVRDRGKPLAGALVEIEHYSPEPPKELPPDEQITRAAKTDPSGVLTCTLTEPGWWCITAQRDGGMKERNGKSYPLRQRVTLWVFVDDKVATKSAP